MKWVTLGLVATRKWPGLGFEHIANLPSKKNCYTRRCRLLGATKRGTSLLGEKKHPPALGIQGSLLPSIKIFNFITRKKDLHFHVPVPSFNPSKWATPFLFFPLLPKHISTTPTSFPPFLGFQTGFQLCNLPGPRSIWLENWVTWKFHSFLRVMKTPRLCSVVLFMQKNTSVVWLTRKNKKKNTAEKRFWFVAIPFARKQKKVPWAFTLGGCLTYQMVTGNGNFWELDSPQLKEKKMHVHQS